MHMEKEITIPFPHPGEIILEEFMNPLGINQRQLAANMGVVPQKINEIIHGKRSITADTALRLSLVFPGNPPEFWLGLQSSYDLARAKEHLSQLEQEVTPAGLAR